MINENEIKTAKELADDMKVAYEKYATLYKLALENVVLTVKQQEQPCRALLHAVKSLQSGRNEKGIDYETFVNDSLKEIFKDCHIKFMEYEQHGFDAHAYSILFKNKHEDVVFILTIPVYEKINIGNVISLKEGQITLRYATITDQTRRIIKSSYKDTELSEMYQDFILKETV